MHRIRFRGGAKAQIPLRELTALPKPSSPNFIEKAEEKWEEEEERAESRNERKIKEKQKRERKGKETRPPIDISGYATNWTCTAYD